MKRMRPTLIAMLVGMLGLAFMLTGAQAQGRTSIFWATGKR